MAAIVQIAKPATDRRATPRVEARAAERMECAPVASTLSGRRWPRAVVRRRRFSLRVAG